jgi:hypothetical protein
MAPGVSWLGWHSTARHCRVRSTVISMSISSCVCPISDVANSSFNVVTTARGRVQPKRPMPISPARREATSVARTWSGCCVTPEGSNAKIPLGVLRLASIAASRKRTSRSVPSSSPSGKSFRTTSTMPNSLAAAANSGPRIAERSPSTPWTVEASPWVRQSTNRNRQTWRVPRLIQTIRHRDGRRQRGVASKPAISYSSR